VTDNYYIAAFCIGGGLLAGAVVAALTVGVPVLYARRRYKRGASNDDG